MKGLTLLANLNGVSEDLLSSDEIISLLLLRCIEAANMTPVNHTLQIAHFPIPVKGKLRGGFGLSAGMILIESHIYIHTWPENGYARFELSSCKPFDCDEVINVLKTFLGREVQIDYVSIPWNGET